MANICIMRVMHMLRKDKIYEHLKKLCKDIKLSELNSLYFK